MKYQVEGREFRTLGRAMEHAQKSQEPQEDKAIFWRRDDIANADNDTEGGSLEAYDGCTFDEDGELKNVAQIVRR
jgi:hypothetical protein